MGPAVTDKVRGLRDMNRGELAIMLAFLVFIFWIGIAPAAYFHLIDSSVGSLVADISNTVLALGQ
jgi:NADH:ubiquinone oxidoreductase subunit 4 (subunit M)